MDPLTRTLLAGLRPLFTAAADPAALRTLLAQLGVELEDSSQLGPDGPLGGLLEPLGSLAGDVEELRIDLEQPADVGTALAVAGRVPSVVADVLAVTRALEDAPSLLADADVPDELRDPAVWRAATERLPGVLLAQAFQRESPGVYLILRALGVVAIDSPAAAGELRWSALSGAVSDPAGALASSLSWGEAELDAEALAELLFAASDALALPLSANSEDGVPGGRSSYELPLASGDLPGAGFVESGVLIEPHDDGGAPGLAIAPYALGDAPGLIDLGGGRYIEIGPAASEAARLILAPGAAPRLDGPGSGLDVAVGATFAQPVLVFGVPGLGVSATGFRLAGRVVDGAVEVELGTAPGLTVGLSLGNDSFMRSLLGDATDVTVDAGMIWRQGSALRFSAGADLSFELPLTITLGPITIERIAVGVELGEVLGLSVTASIGAALGPITVVVDGVGIAGTLEAVDGAPMCPSVRVVPPDGLGLGVDVAGIVSGGGFLDLDPEIGRYAGVGELDVLGVGLVATGILDTQVPSSPLGWSLFLSLAARFPAVQLGFGFTLNGVGGLVGIERGLDDDALGEAVRSGSLDAILFPENAIADAALILSEIDSIFPSAAGQYVFGPIVKVGWGTPTVVELDAGVAIQLPDPLTVSLLGALSAVLPREDTPILELHVNFAGTINLTEGTLKVDASLTGSQVAGLLVTGDMAVRTAFLDNPTFLVAFGGFHPAFDPPADFPDLDKVGVALDTGDALRVTLGGYFALTSNSVQVGARADLWAGGDGFTIEGGTSFNALITFEPFSFSIGMRVWVSVTAGGFELLGVLLSGKLSGPNPWKVHGVAEFRLLGVKTRFSVDESFGELANEGPPEQADPAQLVRDALGLEDAWTAVPPTGPSPVVLGANAADGALHPSGRVQVLQRLLPLDVEIECYGAAELVGDDIVSVDAVGFAAGDVEDAVDWFASAQYFLLSEDEKLTAPSFAQMKGGLVMGGSGADAPAAAEAVFDHEIGYRDPLGRAKAAAAGVTIVAGRDETMTRALGARTTSTPKLRYSIAEPLWTVANPDTARSTGAVPAAGTGFYSARTAMAKRPGTPAVLVPAYEAELIG